MAKHKKPRYIEISRRNRMSRIFVGVGYGCQKQSMTCGDICIDIRRAGQYYNDHHSSKSCGTCYDGPPPACEPQVAHVCALEIDDDGYAVFEWPIELLNLKEGWYDGVIISDCQSCGIVPIRVGPRCNVIEVENIVSGPDCLSYVGCEDECVDTICGKSDTDGRPVYVPSYIE